MGQIPRSIERISSIGLLLVGYVINHRGMLYCVTSRAVGLNA